MLIELTDTTATEVATELVRAHQQHGSSSGLVFTLIIVTDGLHLEEVTRIAVAAGRAHPSRIIIVSSERGRRKARLDASIRTGDRMPGEIVTLRIFGELREHADSVLLPLLLPDLQAVVYWPDESPADPSSDPIGALAPRRITDAASAAKPLTALVERATHHAPGTTDLSWTRTTPWRALLAASLDQYPAKISAACVHAPRGNAPAELIAAWLESRLGVRSSREYTDGPGITKVTLTTPAGDIEIARTEEGLASYIVPGQPRRSVALRRRDRDELIAEELTRMDVDDIFDTTMDMLLKRSQRK